LNIIRIGKTDPFNKLYWEVSNWIEWKGTIGVGDSMMGLNSCHMISYMLDKPVHMDVHWYHDEDYLFHCEDPETIVERFDYIHSLYKENDRVIVNHIFNSNDRDLYKARWRGFNRTDKERGSPPLHINSWIFREDLIRYPYKENKIVIWKPFRNATPAPDWKRSFAEHHWTKILDWYLEEKHGFDITEIDYRTPVREAIYHIKTCRAVVGYEGMWHYIARNLLKPSVFLGDSTINICHDPQAIALHRPDGSLEKLFKEKTTFLETIDNKLNEYVKMISPIYAN